MGSHVLIGVMIVRLRKRLNPTISKNLTSALRNLAKHAADCEKQISKDFADYPANGKAFQRVIRVRMADQADHLLSKAAARAVFVLQTSLLRFGRGSHPGFFVAASHRPNLHARAPKSPPSAATWLPSDFLLGAVQQLTPPPLRSSAIAGRPRCGKLLPVTSPTPRRHSPLQCRLATEATFRGTLEICLEQLRISLHACHDSLLRAPLPCAPALQTRLRFKMLVTIFAGSETFVSFAQSPAAICLQHLPSVFVLSLAKIQNAFQ